MTFRIQDHAPKLQATRGLAALCVTIGHAFLTLNNGRIGQPEFHLSWGAAILAGGELVFQQNTAVIFFFVLSGLVLGQSLQRHPEFRGFLVRRIFRLIPVMWVSIAAALAVIAILPSPPLPGATAWFNAFYGRRISAGEVLSDMAGVTWNVNSVLWSVQVELVMMILLPILWRISSRLSPLANIGVLIILTILALSSWTSLPGWANAVRFAFCFYLGLILPQLLQQGAGAALFGSRALAVGAMAGLLAIELLEDTHRLWSPYKSVADALIATQMLGFVMARGDERVVAWMASRPFVWLGDVSYSFYAYSLSIQLLVGGLLLPAFADAPSDGLAVVLTITMALTTTCCAFAVATFSYRWIEQPMMAAAQRRLQDGGWKLIGWWRASTPS